MKELDWEYIDALMPRSAAESSKNDYGRILCVCGSAGYTGAAFFAAQGAVRMGSGVVTLAVPERAWPVLAVKLSEPVVRPLPCTEDGLFSVRALPRLLELAEHADALLIGSQFIGDDSVCLVLGDNIFYSPNFQNYLDRAVQMQSGACVFGYYVDDPRAFGVVEFDGQGRAISIEEKPRYPKSNYIIPGLYFYDNSVMEIARGLKPSARGELEITDVNIEYMKRGQLHVEKLERDFVWLDAGTAENLLESAQVVRRVQDESGRYIACLEEIAYARGYISRQTLLRHAADLSKTLYGRYLECL